ncbi:hypothetical protein VTL71DRAFT_6883 [Oculimacula yallundae]|uniref:Uncharacterized protein n=1 Tax=Oculimacula yallundae TaxID=86028 RepID=A0ABR4BWA2_9HELO
MDTQKSICLQPIERRLLENVGPLRCRPIKESANPSQSVRPAFREEPTLLLPQVCAHGSGLNGYILSF